LSIKVLAILVGINGLVAGVRILICLDERPVIVCAFIHHWLLIINIMILFLADFEYLKHRNQDEPHADSSILPLVLFLIIGGHWKH